MTCTPKLEMLNGGGRPVNEARLAKKKLEAGRALGLGTNTNNRLNFHFCFQFPFPVFSYAHSNVIHYGGHVPDSSRLFSAPLNISTLVSGYDA